MIVDSSALLAIILKESDATLFASAILKSGSPKMSVASYVEVSLRLDTFENGLDPELDETIEALSIEVVPVALEHGVAARLAAIRFGRRHPAKLNFGDCLTYALAKTTDEPLLFKGNDFSRTDLALVVIDTRET